MVVSLSFPDDLAECHRLLAQQQALFVVLDQRAAEQQQQYNEQQQRYADLEKVLDETTTDFAQLREDHQKAIDELHLLRRWVYGSRHERHVADPRQQHLFEMSSLFTEPLTPADPTAAIGGVAEVNEAAAQAKAAARQQKRADRKLCLDALPQIDHHHDVADDKKVCDQCGREKTCLGEEISRVLDFVPGQLQVHNHHLKKYACTCGKCGVTTAPVPDKPIEKCMAGPGLLSSLIVSKTGDHMPTYRSEDIMVRNGLHIPRSTLCDWMHRSAMLLLPLTAFMTSRILKQSVLWTDDTPVMFFDRNGKPVLTRKGESTECFRRKPSRMACCRSHQPQKPFDTLATTGRR